MQHVAGHELDHLFASGLQPAGPAELPDRGPLSDHAPMLARLS
jgi:endonuclease/exonuclease/phosphatase (EEP) superfamily protein YafD